MSSEDLCAMIFRSLFSEARLINQMILHYYKRTEQHERYQCCHRQNEGLKRLSAVMESQFNAAFQTADLVTLEQTVRGALEKLNENALCNDASSVADPNLVARIQKLASRIIGSIYYLKNHERAIKEIHRAQERGITIRNMDRSDVSLPSSVRERTADERLRWQERNYGVAENLRRQAELGQERVRRVIEGPDSRTLNSNRSVREMTPAEKRDWEYRRQIQLESIRRQAERGQERVRRVHENTDKRIPQPNRSVREMTPEEQRQWDNRMKLQSESIRRQAEKGQQRARRAEANAGQSFAEPPAPPVLRRRSPDEQRVADDFRERYAERIRLNEEMGRERIRAINETGQRPTTANASVRERTPAEQREWEHLKRLHAESIRRRAELGQERRRQYMQDADGAAKDSGAQVLRRRTPEEQQIADEFRERYAERIRLHEEMGRERRRAMHEGPMGTRRALHNQSVRERTPAEQREWQELQRRQHLAIQRKQGLGRERIERAANTRNGYSRRMQFQEERVSRSATIVG